MAVAAETDLLSAADGPAVEVRNPAGQGAAVVVCEHAARRLPAVLGDLGLPSDLLNAHIAWDPGALDVAERLAAALDAPLVAARFSRLAYDCNRPPEAPDAVAKQSECHVIPGNAGLAPATREARVRAIHAPFRTALADLLDTRAAAGRGTALITVHSFTPVWMGARRATEIGVLHDRDARLADDLLARLGAEPYRVARNAPYGPADGVTYTLRAHALPRSLPNVMLEIRSDLIAEAPAQATMASMLARHLAASPFLAGEGR